MDHAFLLVYTAKKAHPKVVIVVSGDTGTRLFGAKTGGILTTMIMRAYGKAGNRNETETGNGNWKWKWEQKKHQSLVQCFLHSVLTII